MSRKDYYHDANAPVPNSIVPAASAVIFDDKGRVLLHKRTDNLLWSLPGGGMDPGENIENTIKREVFEETGFNVEVKRVVGIYTDPNHIIEYSDGEVRQQFSICFECLIVNGKMTLSSESHELCFFKLEEINTIPIHPAQLIRIKDACANSEKTFIR
ncbi:NUDIX domain-containing protein [Cohnella candidum]|uniref:NUDIX domain-containing protein n=1 Tax=Cohnella candidum TaxID=2674991 RepID=A0A3G3K569_9BACL|nr:NUDIX domain-containing protein [Cohnella candidum]AYQ74899.1 NUDIX domain-containing protein [Cohnella candidum]